MASERAAIAENLREPKDIVECPESAASGVLGVSVRRRCDPFARVRLL
jgi:hypothetical protein